MKKIFTHFRAYWWLRYMAYAFIIAITLAALAQVHRLGSNPNSVAKFVYELFRDWAGVIGALLTLMIVSAAFLAIMDNRNARILDKRQRMLKEVIEWVSALKLKTLQANVQTIKLGREKGYERIFLDISDALSNAELIELRASANSIPVKEELNNVWHSAFFCSQLAARITGNKPTDEQRKRWGKNALGIVTRVDQLEEQGNLTDQEMYNGQRDLLEKVSVCLKKLAEFEATLWR